MKMKHPDSKQVIEVLDEQAPMYETQGWASQQGKASSKD